MSIKFNPFPLSDSEYSKGSEDFFRRTVENALLSVYSELSGAVSAQSGEASPASKREMLLSIPEVVEREPKELSFSNAGTISPDVWGVKLIKASGAVVFSDFLNGSHLQEIVILLYPGLGLTTTVENGSNVFLSGSTDYSVTNLSKNGSTLSLINYEGEWFEVGRSER